MYQHGDDSEFSIASFTSEDSDSEASESSQNAVVWIEADATQDEWITHVIGTAVTAFEKKQTYETYHHAYHEEQIANLHPREVTKAEEAFQRAWWQYISAYIAFDDRFIDNYLTQQELIQAAEGLFHHCSANAGSSRAFEEQMVGYFEREFDYCLDGDGTRLNF